MNPIIHNLDEEVQPEFIQIADKKIDISFIPCGISIQLLSKFDEYRLSLKDSKILKEDGTVNEDAGKTLSADKASENADLMIDMISMFTVFKDPEMTKDWIKHNLNIRQMGKILNLVVTSLTRDMKGDSKEPKKKLNGNES